MSSPHLPDPYRPEPYPAQPYAGQPPYPAQPYPVVGYGVDPLTGAPLSDKSKVVAGLLQLLPGFLIGLGGIGRLYAGHAGFGVAQLAVTAVGWMSFWCGFLLFFPFFVYFAAWLWFVIDGIILMAGRPVDGQGRLLRG